MSVDVTALVTHATAPLRPGRLVLRRADRPGVLAVVAAMILLGAAPSAEAAAPKVGRWAGTRGDGLRVSFTIHAVPGGRFIANEVSISGGAAAGPDVVGDRSYAWPLSKRGAIRNHKHGVQGNSWLQGRLRRTWGTVCWGGRFAGVNCSPTRRKPIRVRWVAAKHVASGVWELSEGVNGSQLRFSVIGGAVFANASGSLIAPSLTPLHGPCARAGQGVVWDGWIEPGGSFAVHGGPGNEAWVAGRFDTPTSASGTYSAGAFSGCFNRPFGFGARLVDPTPRPRSSPSL